MTDIEMPNMDGLEFCRRVREKSRSIPIIITTAYTTTEIYSRQWLNPD